MVTDTQRKQTRQSAKEVDSGKPHEAEKGHGGDVQGTTGPHALSISKFFWRTHRLGVGRGWKGGTAEVPWVPGHGGLQVLVGHLINNVVGKENRVGQNRWRGMKMSDRLRQMDEQCTCSIGWGWKREKKYQEDCP